ncbi:radical SAM family heme chaperone HemW [Butyrivibrio sp. VCB2006]|uniref:radical SAM family heme chaperone HemW n=1 Tax=Butyrivibrio sp. VCB2006 TaxID=1280679 RepID=UPI00040B37D0|nr:radical SAM family heme chaperone HemW [Butyrivibrio sp. VCB2006]
MQERDTNLSLYVHIPFCVRKCLYCDFLSFCPGGDNEKEYFKALEHEIECCSEANSEFEVKSIFFGGGTPSFPDSSYICKTLEKIRESFHVSPDAEISIEANPASAMSDKLKAFKAAGINRISIGAQSLNDEELRCLGRVHDSKMFFDTFDNARKAGFANINVDVMSALPGQSFDSYMETLKKVLSLGPEHISAYSLIVEEGTPFYDMDLDLPDEDTDRRMYHETKRILLENGYHRYEISNYAQEKHECYHNKVYWTRGNYLGLGLGASSMVDNVRWKNTSDFGEYLKKDDIRRDEQKLSLQDQMEEYMFLGLRLVKGVSISAFKENFSQDIYRVYGTIIEKYVSEKLLQINEDYLSLTDIGLDVSNTVMADFLLDK